MPSPRPTARVIVIGNEILRGGVVDTNGPFLLRRLAELGVRCTGLVTVPDEVDAIAGAVREASEGADLVFTSGGIGPTHDDCTMVGVARAFGVEVVEDPELARVITEKWEGPATPARLRMARVPEGADLLPGRWFPQVRVRNVYVLPGVPGLLRRKFDALAAGLAVPVPARASLKTLQGETSLVPHLDAVAAAFPEVDIGSYPTWETDEYRVQITFEADTLAQVLEARQALVDRLDPDRLVCGAPPLRGATGAREPSNGQRRP